MNINWIKLIVFLVGGASNIKDARYHTHVLTFEDGLSRVSDLYSPFSSVCLNLFSLAKYWLDECPKWTLFTPFSHRWPVFGWAMSSIFEPRLKPLPSTFFSQDGDVSPDRCRCVWGANFGKRLRWVSCSLHFTTVFQRIKLAIQSIPFFLHFENKVLEPPKSADKGFFNRSCPPSHLE